MTSSVNNSRNKKANDQGFEAKINRFSMKDDLKNYYEVSTKNFFWSNIGKIEKTNPNLKFSFLVVFVLSLSAFYQDLSGNE